MSIKIIEANSISAAFQAAVDLIAAWASEDPPLCWFRGVKDTTRSLQAGACWRTSYSEMEPLLSLIQEGVAFTEVGNLEQWETYYLAQHHGIPTRLLDWTESFAAALFFAFDRWDGITTPCVWILQPAPLNNVFLKWNGVLAPENIRQTYAWLPKQIAKNTRTIEQDDDGYVYDNQWPLAIYPKKTNKRITAQQGSFTVHGRDPKPLDELITLASGDPSSIIAKIELKGFDRHAVVHHLGLLGIRRSAIYPDVDNFVTQLKEYYKW